MKLLGMSIEKSARDKQWGFTSAAEPRFIEGSREGVLICHGFGGSPSNMRCLTDAAAQMGLTVCAPLLRGHASTLGEMEKYGWQDWRADADEAFERLVSYGCERIVLCGLSMGALLMADLAERRADDCRIDSLILISPALKMRAYLDFSNHVLKKAAPYVLTADSFKQGSDKEMYYGMATKKLNDIELLSKAVRSGARRIKAPVRLIAAGKDNRVAPSTYRILQKSLADCEYSVIEGAPHGIPYSAEADKLVEIFKEYVGRRLKLADKYKPTGGN